MNFFMNLVDEIGRGVLFLGEVLSTAWRLPIDRQTLLTQIYRVTMQSLLTTAAAGLCVGAIMCLQFNAQLKEFGALSVLGGLATSGTIRALGPLLIAFMLSGKVGAFTSAELGTMRVTEQIDAMKCLGTNPMQYLIVPRFLAIVIASFFLLLAGLLMSIWGGIIMGSLLVDMSAAQYIGAIPVYVTWGSVASGVFKCLCGSICLATICTYKGYTTTGGAKGVGRTVIATALSTMVGIVLVDWLTTWLVECAYIFVEGVYG